MNKTKFFISLIVAVSVVMVQVGGVFAAPASEASAPISGTVQSITLESDSSTGITTVIVEVKGADQVVRTVRVSEKIAKDLGLVVHDGDGNPVINNLALGQFVEIAANTVIPDQEADRHPVGDALATFFSDIPDLDYSMIMTAHQEGMGFGVIAQALWLTVKLEGNSEVFQALLLAKETGEYDTIVLNDGTTVKNWGQLRKAILDGKKISNLGTVMSNKDNGNNQSKDKEKDNKQDKDKGNSGDGNDKEKKK